MKTAVAQPCGGYLSFNRSKTETRPIEALTSKFVSTSQIPIDGICPFSSVTSYPGIADTGSGVDTGSLVTEGSESARFPGSGFQCVVFIFSLRSCCSPHVFQGAVPKAHRNLQRRRKRMRRPVKQKKRIPPTVTRQRKPHLHPIRHRQIFQVE